MFQTPSFANCVVMLIALTCATIVDVRSRRIPNMITFPATTAGVILGLVQSGPGGLVVALAGAFLAPFTLLLLRGFRPLGMGDVKLAAAVGALTGPAVGAASMLVSTVTGGALALLWLLRPGASGASWLEPMFIGVPVLGRIYRSGPDRGAASGRDTLPYGLAISIGSLLTVGFLWWTP